MPKKRSGNKYKVLYDQSNGLIKSGILTKNYKNVILEENNKQGTIPVNNIFSKKGKISYSHSYDDNNTILFNQKTIDIVTKTDATVSKSKILSTPSTFTFSDLNLSSQNTNSIFYDRLLEKNILEETIEPFDENTTFHENKEGEFSQDIEIEIPLDFNQKNGGVCQLSINNSFGFTGTKNGSISSFPLEKIQYPKTPVSEIWYRNNSPMSYFNFTDNRWDYLGDITQYSYIEDNNNPGFHYEKNDTFKWDNDSSFLRIREWVDKTHLGFLGVTNDPNVSTYYNPLTGFYNDTILGSPIGNFGFPSELKYEGRKENLINLQKYITKDFYLKKFVVEGTFSSRAIGSPNRSGNPDMNTSQANVCINLVNFFLLNQRKNLNTSKVNEDETGTPLTNKSDFEIYGFFDSIDSSLNPTKNFFNFFNTPDFNSNYKRSNFGNSNIISENPSIENNLSKQFDSQRELITYNTLVNYSEENVIKNTDSNFNASENVYLTNIERITNFVDKVETESDDLFENNTYRGNSLNHPYVHYDKRKIKIESKVKTPIRQNRSHPYSRYRLLPSSFQGNRTLLKDILSGRSNKQESNSLKLKETKTIAVRSRDYNSGTPDFYEDSFPYNIYEVDRVEDVYCLKPSDELLLGVNLSTAFSNPEVNMNYAVNNPSTGGHYSEFLYGEDTFVIHDLKIKLIGSYNKKENVINTYNNSSLTSKNIRRSSIGDTTVADKLFTTPHQLLSGNYFERSYNSHGIGSSLSTASNEKSVTNSLSLKIEDETILDSMLPNIVDLLAVSNITPNASKQLVVGIPGETSTGNIFSFWYNEGPFLAKYSNVDRPEEVDYSRLLNDLNISASFGTEIYEDYANNGGDLVLVDNVNTENALKYFYTFNSKNSSRFPVEDRDFDFGTSGTQSKNELVSFEGFKIGAINYKPISSNVRFSSLGFGQYKNIVNKFTNYARKVKDLNVYTIEKIFYDENYVIVDTSQTNTLNTYNKDYYSRITKPFIDKTQEEYDNENSSSTP
jgi:hypothetical protein